VKNAVHGLWNTRVYRAYQSAKQRCENPKNASYEYYGARGIRFLWPNFEAFFATMGHPPPSASLDRKNPNGHYEPGNCRWATDVEQSNNRRDNRVLAAFDRTQTINEWARELNIPRNTLIDRLRRGMSDEQALAAPVRSYTFRIRPKKDKTIRDIQHDTKKGLPPIAD
jgi:hypothetical protein